MRHPPPNHILYIKAKIGLEIKHFQVAKCRIFKTGMQPPKNKFRLKKGPEIEHFVAHQMQKFLRPTQGGVQTPNLYTYEFKLREGLKDL